MQVIDDLTKAHLGHESVVTVGAFDGLHLGHQALITALVERARATGRLAVVVTFHPHPAAILTPERAPQYLTTPSERVALLEGLGVDLVALLPFTRQLAAIPARDFVAKMVDNLRVREICIGPDFALGRFREGDAAHLREISHALCFELHIVDPVSGQPAEVKRSPGLDGAKAGAAAMVSSSRIRQLLHEGRVGDASPLLGRYYSLSGQVMPALDQSGIPGSLAVTLEVSRQRAVPAGGVYAVLVTANGDRYPGVAEVGAVPSLEEGRHTIGLCILGCERDIFGCGLVVEFVQRLGDNRQSWDADPGTDQIRRVLADAQRMLDSPPGSGSLPGLGMGRSDRRSTPCRFRYQEIEHTADRALKVWGRELADLFAGAACGMYGMMADIDGLVATGWREISLEGLDHEALLVDWLNELLFVTEAEGLLFVDYQIADVTEQAIVARAGGVPGEVTLADIKAATFHDLAVVQGEDGWTTVVTFDV